MKKVLQPPDARTLKYTVDIPLKRPEILPKEILQLASPVNFDKISSSKSFEIEKDLLKGINSHFNLKQVQHIFEPEFINESCNDQCLLLDCLTDPATNFENTLYNKLFRIARNLVETRENIKIESRSFYHIICD